MREIEIRATVKCACERSGVQRVADALHLSAEATARLAGGLRVQQGTVLVAREHLANLDSLVARATG